MKCKCEDPYHPKGGCPIDNDGTHGDICQACYTRCHDWNQVHERGPHKSTVGKGIKVIPCIHPPSKTIVKEFKDFHAMKEGTTIFCKVCNRTVAKEEKQIGYISP